MTAERLREYEGDFDTRHVELRDGALFYYREGTDDPTPRRLYPISDDTFVLKDFDFFRLRFDRESDGTVHRVVGLYIDGNQDESPRS